MSALLEPAAPLSPLDETAGSPSLFLSRPGIRERVVMVLTLFVYAWGLPNEWLVFASGGSIESSPITQVVLFAFLIHSVICLNGNWHVVIRAASREPLMASFLGLLTVSAAWSTVPFATLTEGVILFVVFLTALHVVVRFSDQEILSMLAIVFATGAMLNLAFVAAFESLNTFTLVADGSVGWAGITGNRNTLGRAAVLGYLVCALYARVSRSWLVWPCFAVLNAILVFGSGSATTLGAFLGLNALAGVFLGFRGRKTLYGATAVAMGVVFVTLTALAATNLAALTGALGRESNFTGRAPIWRNSIEFGVSQRPFLGYGHSGFWQQGFTDFEVQVRTNNFDTPHAHNAWVDALLEVGPLGAVLYSALIVRALLWATRRIRSVPTSIGMFPALTISMAVVFSLTEAGFVSRSIQFIMFIVAIVIAAQEKGARRPFVPKRHEEQALPH